ncbi:MAG: dimethylsulfoniopropionate demethylase [Candidatus Puniceispirillaceae bacterium]
MTDGLQFARRIRTSPYFRRVEAHGITGYSVYNHMILPKSFAMSAEESYWHLNEHVQIWDVSVQRQVEIRGPDAARLVQWMTPRDLRKTEIGRCYYIPVVDSAGGMLNDPVLLKLAEDRFWLSVADSDLLLYVKGLAIGGGFDVTVREPDVNPLAIQGPKAADVMSLLFGKDAASLKFFHFTHIDLFGTRQIVSRSGFSATAGFEIYLDDSRLAEPLWDLVWEAGQPFGMQPGGPNLIDRIEAGLLGYGNEMTQDNNPLEMGYGRFCVLDGSIDFIGREALQAIAADGPERMIRGVRFEGPPCPACHAPWPVHVGDRQVGRITSAAWSPRYESNLGLSLIDLDFLQEGQRLSVSLPDGGQVAGRVCELPFRRA